MAEPVERNRNVRYLARRRIDRACARLSHAKLLLESFGFGEDLELALVAAQSELLELEKFNREQMANDQRNRRSR